MPPIYLFVLVVGFRQAICDRLLPCDAIRRAARGISDNEIKIIILTLAKALFTVESFVQFSNRLCLFFLVIPYDWALLDLAAYSPPFKAEFHVGSPLKKADALLPADAALAVLKPDELRQILFDAPIYVAAFLMLYSQPQIF